MGWSYETYGSSHSTKKAFLLAEFPAGTEFLASSWSGSACALVVVPPTTDKGTPTPYVSISLLAGSASSGFGAKHMDEACGPNEVGFSKRFLAVVEKHIPTPPNDYAIDWRESVRESVRKSIARKGA